jgi:hypothetical protein
MCRLLMRSVAVALYLHIVKTDSQYASAGSPRDPRHRARKPFRAKMGYAACGE